MYIQVLAFGDKLKDWWHQADASVEQITNVGELISEIFQYILQYILNIVNVFLTVFSTLSSICYAMVSASFLMWPPIGTCMICVIALSILGIFLVRGGS